MAVAMLVCGFAAGVGAQDRARPDPWAALDPPAASQPQTGVTEANSGVVAATTPPDAEARPLPRAHVTNAKVAPTPGAAAGAESARPWTRTGLSLAAVLMLILLLAWGYRQVAAGGLRWTARGRHPGLIEVLGRTALSPRHSLCLVRVGPRLILLGVTPTSVSALDTVQNPELTAQLAGEAARRRPESHSAAFAACLESQARKLPATARTADPAHTAKPEDTAVTNDTAEAAATGDMASRADAGDRGSWRGGDIREQLAERLQRLRSTSRA
jgi:flagellar biogenesis protein FliO